MGKWVKSRDFNVLALPWYLGVGAYDPDIRAYYVTVIPLNILHWLWYTSDKAATLRWLLKFPKETVEQIQTEWVLDYLKKRNIKIQS